MAADRDTRIRERAHAIWEQEGRQHGGHDRHWAQAQAEIDAEDRQAEAHSKAEKPATAKASTAKDGRRKRSMTDAAVDAVTRVAGAALNAAAETVTGGAKRGRPARGATKAAEESPKRAASTSGAATTRGRAAGTATRGGSGKSPAAVDRAAAANKPAPTGGRKGR